VETAVPLELEFSLSPERLEEGDAEEIATFGHFSISNFSKSLTAGFDWHLDNYRRGPLVPANHIAEWIAWNWWRLRWETRSAAGDWGFAHRMNTIGEGYVWPNLEIFSDGVRTAFISLPSKNQNARPFRYIGHDPVTIPSTLFEETVDAFVSQVIGRLQEAGIRKSNLAVVWSDVLAERGDADLTTRRKLEAYLGRDPDSIDDGAVDRLIADSERLGEAALREIAADRAQQSGEIGILDAEQLDREASEVGYEVFIRNAIRLSSQSEIARGADTPAYRLGARFAQSLRSQERFGQGPISDKTLAEMAGTSAHAISENGTVTKNFAFALDKSPLNSRIVLRSKWIAGKRFELARLIGDRIFGDDGSLHPATRSSTYRQKAQRSFAAELLSPFEQVDDMLDGDFSQERQQEVAEYFQVSDRTIDTILKNHGQIPRDSFDQVF
jgi:hypothetical protein